MNVRINIFHAFDVMEDRAQDWPLYPAFDVL